MNSQQLTLLGPDVPYRKVDTSIEAAKAVRSNVTRNERIVLDVVRSRGRVTVDEICLALGWPRNSVAPRVTMLGPGTERNPGKGLLRDTGERRKVDGQRTPAIVWELAR